MKETFIATFYSHFAAVHFKKEIDALGITRSRLMPVPRSLSSSCGVCVRFETDAAPLPERLIGEDLEQIVRIDGSEFISVYQAKNG